jgi:ribosomal protein S21
MDIAMRLLKAPVVDTDVPGVQMAYMEGDPRLWTYEHGMLGGADQQVWNAEESHPRGIIGNVPSTQAIHVGDKPVNGGQVTQMTPNDYFDALRNVKQDAPYRTDLSGDRYYHDIPDASADWRWPDKGKEHIQDMTQGISEGQVMGMPSIDVSTGGQEGGHRMEALRQMGYGDTEVPVMTYSPQQPQEVQTGEPMDLAWRLLKHATSPAALANKKKYDTKYENNPKRKSYRAELARERRKRGVMGSGGDDMSHTKGGNMVPESPSKNRARHFAERGTLK